MLKTMVEDMIDSMKDWLMFTSISTSDLMVGGVKSSVSA